MFELCITGQRVIASESIYIIVTKYISVLSSCGPWYESLSWCTIVKWITLIPKESPLRLYLLQSFICFHCPKHAYQNWFLISLMLPYKSQIQRFLCKVHCPKHAYQNWFLIWLMLPYKSQIQRFLCKVKYLPSSESRVENRPYRMA